MTDPEAEAMFLKAAHDFLDKAVKALRENRMAEALEAFEASKELAVSAVAARLNQEAQL